MNIKSALIILACLCLVPSGLLLSMSTNTHNEIEFCIMCCSHQGSLCAHYSRFHKLKSRVFYLCDYCTYASTAIEIKRHYKAVHLQQIGTIAPLYHIRIPVLSSDPTITPEDMRYYASKAETLLNGPPTFK